VRHELLTLRTMAAACRELYARMSALMRLLPPESQPFIADLVSLAERSGAEYRRLKSYDQLRVAFQRIADELHLQYLLGFAPAAFDGKRHDIDVKAKRPGVTVRARKTYVATRAGG